MYMTDLKKISSNVRGHHIDAYGITHYAPDWDLSMLKCAFSRNALVSNVVGFETFCSIVDKVTDKFYFVFMCCYPKLSDNGLFDLVINEVCEEIQSTDIQ